MDEAHSRFLTARHFQIPLPLTLPNTSGQCSLLHNFLASTPTLLDASGNATVVFSKAGFPLAGIYFQGIAADAAANALGVIATNGGYYHPGAITSLGGRFGCIYNPISATGLGNAPRQCAGTVSVYL